ncbi:MAG: radical SAM protein [Anaerolineales bacterium]|nr:radical SAM protein [Anaerolineales bacterium]
MIKEIQAKLLLNRVPQPDSWFGLRYNMNIYRGCQHQCIYCDSRSECYQIEDFSDVLVKVNAVELLRKELSSKRIKGTIGTGSMNDPYMPVEKQYNLTRQSLEVIRQFHFPIHILTKSDLVLRDLETLQEINKVYAAVSFSITTVDDELGKQLEPGAPLVSARYQAMETLAEHGILTGVAMMPVLPFLEDNIENITALVSKAHQSGAAYIIPSFGVSLRSGSRDYYYEKLDKHFPGVSESYKQRFGNMVHCPANNIDQLREVFTELCNQYSLATAIPQFKLETAKQLRLF